MHRTRGGNRSGGIERIRLDAATGAIIGRDVVADWPDDKVAGLDVARDGDLWVAARATTQDEVFFMDVGPDGLPIGEPTRVTSHRRSDRPTDWLPDGRVVFTSDRSGVFDVLAQRPGEADAVRIAAGPAIQTWGRVTSTGAILYWEIVPVASASDVQHAALLRYDAAEGTPPRTLLEVEIESALRLSGRPPPATAWVSCARGVEKCVVGHMEGDRYTVQFVDPLTGRLGDPIRRVELGDYQPNAELSPDGTRVAMVHKGTLSVISVDDKNISEIPLAGFTDLQFLAWRPDGESLYVTGWHSAQSVALCSVALVDLRTQRVVPVHSSEAWKGQVTVSWDGRRIAWLDWDGSNEVFLYERTPD
jgi:hypothetical protein